MQIEHPPEEFQSKNGDPAASELIASQAGAAGLSKGTSADIGSYIDQWWYLSAEVPWELRFLLRT
jgi:hypothetical protein